MRRTAHCERAQIAEQAPGRQHLRAVAHNFEGLARLLVHIDEVHVAAENNACQGFKEYESRRAADDGGQKVVKKEGGCSCSTNVRDAVAGQVVVCHYRHQRLNGIVMCGVRVAAGRGSRFGELKLQTNRFTSTVAAK